VSKKSMRDVRPVDALRSPRFAGISTFARLPYSKDLDYIDVAFVGIPFDDGTTFRTGARFGPKAVREVSALLRPYNPVLNVKPFDILNVIDYGDVDVVPGYIEDTYERIEREIAKLVEKDIVPLVCGGDHSITLPVLRALSRKYGRLSLIHIDAHSDCWDEYFGRKYNHGTVFKRALEEGLVEPRSSIHLGMRGPVYSENDYKMVRDMGYNLVTMYEIREMGIDGLIRRVRMIAGRNVYVSFDVDACDPSIAPGTGTPEVGGFLAEEVLKLLRGLAGLNFVGFDVVEVSPPYDHGGVTALLASNILYEFLSLVAVSRKARS